MGVFKKLDAGLSRLTNNAVTKSQNNNAREARTAAFNKGKTSFSANNLSSEQPVRKNDSSVW